MNSGTSTSTILDPDFDYREQEEGQSSCPSHDSGITTEERLHGSKSSGSTRAPTAAPKANKQNSMVSPESAEAEQESCCPTEIPQLSQNDFDWSEFEEYNELVIKLEKAERITDIRHGERVKTLSDVTEESLLREMEKMYGSIDPENPEFQPFFIGFKNAKVTQLQQMLHQEQEYMQRLKTDKLGLIDKTFDCTFRVRTEISNRFAPPKIIAFQNILSNTGPSGQMDVFCIPRKVKIPTFVTDKEKVRQNIWSLTGDYPYGFTKEVLDKEYEDRFGIPLELKLYLDAVWTPPPEFQLRGMSEILFSVNLKNVLPPIKDMAWFIWHKIQILLGSRGLIQIKEVELLLSNHFNIVFKPEAWGFESFYQFLEFFGHHFGEKGSGAGVLKILRDRPRYGPPHEGYQVLVSCDPEVQRIVENVEKKHQGKPIVIPGKNLSQEVLDPLEYRDPSEDFWNMWKEFVRTVDFPKYFKHSICKGDVYRCLTVKVFSFQKFYLHFVDTISQFKRFEQCMREFFNSKKPFSTNVPQVGSLLRDMYLAVLHKKDEGEVPLWYRAQVLYLCNDSRAAVQLIDYGHTGFVNREDMRFLPRVFLLEQDVMAIPCQFLVPDKAKDEILKEDGNIGRLLKEYLLEKQDVELVKFHHRWMEPGSHRIVWIITSVLCDFVLDKFTHPGVSLCELIYHKFFNKKERASKLTSKVMNFGECTDWTRFEDEISFVKQPDPCVYDVWIAKEAKFSFDNSSTFYRPSSTNTDSNTNLPEVIHGASYEECESEVRMFELFHRKETQREEIEKDLADHPQQLNEYDRATDEYMSSYCSGAFGGIRTKSNAR